MFNFNVRHSQEVVKQIYVKEILITRFLENKKTF